MLPEAVWNIPKYGTFNLHASLLPKYRGAAPINWAIINGERISGVTTFFIEHQIDTGNIIFQEKVNIEEEDDAGHLHDKLMKIGSQLVCKTIDAIIPIEQHDIPNNLIKAAIENIPEEPFTYETWDKWTKSIIEQTGLKGKSLFMPLRLLLTGKDKGPELKNFLPLLDKQTLLRKFGKI